MSSNYYKIAYSGIVFLKKYYKIYIVTIILGIVISYILSSIQTPYYKGYIYARTGLLQNTSANYDFSAVYYELSYVKTKLTDHKWIKNNMNQDSTGFITMKISVEKPRNTRYQVMRIILYTKYISDFEKFKKGIIFYFNNKSTLNKIYNRQKALLGDSIKMASKNLALNNKNIVFNISNIYAKYLYEFNYTFPVFYFVTDFYGIKFFNPKKNPDFTPLFYLFAVVFIITLIIELILYLKKISKYYENKTR